MTVDTQDEIRFPSSDNEAEEYEVDEAVSFIDNQVEEDEKKYIESQVCAGDKRKRERVD